ncbi:MAG: T9SS type A sorting domain-containing protein [Crocinitomicaceae bacterium]|nr:T9SS type A sorting domain-containing protein [Crocinitomicaceae bacterium]
MTGFAGLEENNAFTIYPNPASAIVVLDVQPDAIVRIYSTSGTLVYEAIGETTIDVSNFAAGIYQVTVLQNETTSTQKLSVQ